MAEFTSKIRTIQWIDNVSRMVDQTKFPEKFEYVDIKTGQEMFDAIRTMIVRGAPAIGIGGAHGVVLYAQEGADKFGSREEFVNWLIEKAEYMKTSRPTAVNLMWAVEKQIEVIRNSTSDIKGLIEELKINGIKLENEDIEIINHTFSETYAFDEAYHYYECQCGEKKDVENHDYGEGETVVEESNLTNGLKIKNNKARGIKHHELYVWLN